MKCIEGSRKLQLPFKAKISAFVVSGLVIGRVNVRSSNSFLVETMKDVTVWQVLVDRTQTEIAKEIHLEPRTWLREQRQILLATNVTSRVIMPKTAISGAADSALISKDHEEGAIYK